jgi:uncharacterized protein (DUF2252 family)
MQFAREASLLRAASGLILMDLKEAVQAAAPMDEFADMPEDQAQRVVEGARNLSPYLGERMRAI